MGDRFRSRGKMTMPFIIPLTLWVALLAPPVGRDAWVTSVHDGDTCTVKYDDGYSEHIRLLGIDACELEQGAPGIAARDWLAARLRDGRVRVVEDSHHARDLYGRHLAYLFVGEECINVEAVREGRVFPYKPRGKLDQWEAIQAAAAEAKMNRVGVWQGDTVPPWIWRQRHRKKAG
jgi:micrococcal nuclease